LDSTRKRILVVTAFPPNELTAGQNYTRLLVEDLIKQYDVDLIAFSYPGHKIAVAEGARILKEIKITKIEKLLNAVKLPWFHPFFTARYSWGIKKYISSISPKYYLLYFDFSQTFIYAYYTDHPYKVMMVHDVVIQKISRETSFLNRMLYPLMERTENILLHKAQKIFCFSDKDRELLKSFYNVNAFKVDFYLRQKQPLLQLDTVQIQNKFILFAAWNRKENAEGLEWFLENVYPKVEKDIFFEIIGAGVNRELREKINRRERIKYTGFVKDPYGKILQAKALIVPLFKGAGVKVKVLEALAAGTNVIGTDIAFEGIEIPAMNNLMFFCANRDEFVNAINGHIDVTIQEKKIAIEQFKNSYPKEKILKYL
jgi:glycosyltransferase involved in cell wall biosynthesis